MPSLVDCMLYWAAILTESELLQLIRDRCNELGLLWFHSYDSRADRLRGWPDLVIVGHGILFRELKSASGNLASAQQDWGKGIKGAGGDFAVWRVQDWDSGLVQRELRELAECPHTARRMAASFK